MITDKEFKSWSVINQSRILNPDFITVIEKPDDISNKDFEKFADELELIIEGRSS